MGSYAEVYSDYLKMEDKEDYLTSIGLGNGREFREDLRIRTWF